MRKDRIAIADKRQLYVLISKIPNKPIRTFTYDMFDVVPVTFWTIPSSSSGKYHPADERNVGGAVLHAMRVYEVAYRILETLDVGSIEWSIDLSASLLHDTCCRDIDGLSDHTVDDHPLLVRRLANLHGITCVFATDVFNIIEAHMGKWGPVRYLPALSCYAVLHLADYIASKENIHIDISRRIKNGPSAEDEDHRDAEELSL